MSLTCYIYNWELFIKDDYPIIIGFGYNENDSKIAVVIKDFPLFKYSDSVNRNFDYINNKKEVLKKILLRHYLDGEQTIYKDTIGWIYSKSYQENNSDHYTTFNNEYIVSYKSIHAKNIDKYPESSILSFDIECMSHDFGSFPNSYLYNDFISTISIVYHYKDIQRNITICVKYKDKNNIVNELKLNEIDPSFISFIDINKFNDSCKKFNFFDENNINNNIDNDNSENNDINNQYDNNKNSDNNNNYNIKSNINNNDNYNNINIDINDNKVMNNKGNDVNKDTIIINNNTEVKNRYNRLKKLLNNNFTYHSDTKKRYNKLKSMLNNSVVNVKLIKDDSLNNNDNTVKEETFVKSDTKLNRLGYLTYHNNNTK
ncbi:hypothetical protein BCR36DRAFT_397307 [Piromyces finnis]|uniref:DNA-directed DNA polymerase family B exonuclease domain-containing protein n=1 Tax=Piromyces finnis TaxID=1754191 RepID=A0A1Y1VBP0_9FUNG|nr:hypothetical protein BCR36DRAFT_397307 [Piromyces finnis]|eukprot:ORX51123.1 hypothetical protein BCR36DRAFT_397307 [Piromyces finnis]